MHTLKSLGHKVFLPTSLALAMMMVGCSDKSATSNESANIDPNVLAEKQELVINNGAEPESLDPHKISGVPESNLLRQMLVGLTTTDPQGKTIPGMAERYHLICQLKLLSNSNLRFIFALVLYHTIANL